MELPQGWFYDSDIATYKSLVSKIEHGNILEIGCWKGRSICSVAEEIIKNKNLVYCVDTFEGTENEQEAHSEAKTINLKAEFQNNLRNFKLHNNVSVIQMESLKAVNSFRDCFFDLIFIDADHSKEAVIADILSWLPKLKRNGVLAGHDFSWDSVREALKELNLLQWVKVVDNFWYIKKSRLIEDNGHVTAVVCTKDRYASLFTTIHAIITQTQKPEYLLVYDDSDFKVNLLEDRMWGALFFLLENSGIIYRFIFTDGVGQVRNHQNSLEYCISEYIWRVDDDLIPENTNLEKLYKTITEKEAGAVGGKIITHNVSGGLFMKDCSSLIDDIYEKPNIQLAIDGKGIHSVDHLHCSFIYKRNTGADYDIRLSRVGHREETMFTASIVEKGFEIYANLDTYSMHTKEPVGGIRSEGVDNAMFQEDEEVFKSFLKKLDIQWKKMTPKNSNLVYIDCGLGDHIQFIKCIPELLKAKKKLVLAVTYLQETVDLLEELGYDMCNIKLISIAEADSILYKNGTNKNSFQVYRYAHTKNLKMPFKDIILEMYL